MSTDTDPPVRVYPTLKEYLKDADRNIVVEENFLDNPDPIFKGVEEQVLELEDELE